MVARQTVRAVLLLTTTITIQRAIKATTKRPEMMALVNNTTHSRITNSRNTISINNNNINNTNTRISINNIILFINTASVITTASAA